MSSSYRALAAGTAVSLLFAGAALAADARPALTTHLTGAAEVPGPGDADATGTASVTIDPATMQVCYDLQVAHVDTPTMAHIHKGAVGVAGPIVVVLKTPVDGHAKACATTTHELATAILATPADYYVNVHNEAHPKGALRGQLGN